MKEQFDFDFRSGYPEEPGFKEAGGTSEEAAARINSHTLRATALHYLAIYEIGLTADEIAAKAGVDKLAMRPRLSELFAMGMVEKSTKVRNNRSGKSARVWVITQVGLDQI